MLSNLFLFVGAVVALLTILDLLLSEVQKQALADASVQWWSYLDDLNRLSFLQSIHDRRIQRWASAVCAAFFSAAIVISEWKFITSDYWLGLAIIVSAIATLVLGPLILAFLSRKQSWKSFLLRVLAIFAIVWFGPILLGLPLFYLAIQDNPSLLSDPDFMDKDPIGDLSRLPPALRIPILLIAIIPGQFIPLIFLGSYVIALFRGALYSGELIVRRIVEYPKGPVLALAAIGGGVAALLKVFM